MTDHGPMHIIIANRNAGIASIILLLVFVAAYLDGVYDPVYRSTAGQLWPGVLLVVPMVLAGRSLTVGVVVVGNTVISRGWLRTRTISRADISAVRAVNYSGILNRSGASTRFSMVELEVAGSCVKILALIGRAAKVGRLADQLSDSLGITPSPAESEAHRIQG